MWLTEFDFAVLLLHFKVRSNRTILRWDSRITIFKMASVHHWIVKFYFFCHVTILGIKIRIPINIRLMVVVVVVQVLVVLLRSLRCIERVKN